MSSMTQTQSNRTRTSRTQPIAGLSAERIAALGQGVVRYGLALVLVWIGAMKFTAYEAQAIAPLVQNSPFMAWVYGLFSMQGFSNLLGVVEVGAGLLIAARAFAPRLSAAGSALAVLIFAGTLSFILTTPGWEASLGGFPTLSVVPGQFLIKDLVLLGAALWTLGDALKRS